MDFLNTPEKRDRRLVHLPMGRFGEAIEVARGALFRESHTAVHVTITDNDLLICLKFKWQVTTAAT